MTRSSLATAALVLTSISFDAYAGGSKAECAKAASLGQSARDAGRLLEAREQFVACATKACPGVVVKDCATWLADVEARIPSVVLVARDGDRDATDATVSVDGAAPIPITGSAVRLDPGPHAFEFSRPGATVTERVMLREGEKERRVVAEMAPAEITPEPAKTSIAPVVAFGAVAAVGAVAYVAFGVAARSERSSLESSCAPACTDAQVAPIRTSLVLSNVGFGVGVVGVVGLAATLLLQRSAPKSAAVHVIGPGTIGAEF